MDLLPLSPLDALRAQAMEELRNCNDVTIRYGLYLTEEQMRNLADKRAEALIDTGRIELGEGLLRQLIIAFCDSPYIDRHNYEETVAALVDLFYALKNEARDRIADDELIQFMKARFDGSCGGSLECLYDAALWDLCLEGKNNG